MSAQPSTPVAAPTLTCGSCQAVVQLQGKRVGDSIHCPGCKALNVITRTKVKGELPVARRTGGLNADERQNVAETLRRIQLRRLGRSTQHVSLYPNWAVFVAGVQFYLAAILAAENLSVMGFQQRGRRLRVFGIVSYVVLAALVLAEVVFLGDVIPLWVNGIVLGGIPLVMAVYFTNAQAKPTEAAREAGATQSSVLLPLLFGLILAITQAFAVWFLKLQLDRPF
ncbi:MAG: hypothetical protein KDD82_28620 [Planctomycetes bacterium]|nr:hypothetical protein [Planctomycetota bacterium]